LAIHSLAAVMPLASSIDLRRLRSRIQVANKSVLRKLPRMQFNRASRWYGRIGNARRLLATVLVLPCAAWADSSEQPLPTLAELEAAGARIGQIRVVTDDIFDLADPKEDKLLFRWANALHIRTRPAVIEHALGPPHLIAT
jgi:hypothetical protein